MIDILTVKSKTPRQGVNEFMRQYGTNHVALTKGWKKFPAMKTDAELLEECLAWALQKKAKREVLGRILGRLRMVHKEAEDKQVLELTQDLSCLE